MVHPRDIPHSTLCVRKERPGHYSLPQTATVQAASGPVPGPIHCFHTPMSGGLTREVTRRGQNRTPTKAGPHVAKNRASRLGVGRRDTAWRKPQVQRGRPGPARGLGPLFYRGRTLAAAGQPTTTPAAASSTREFFLGPAASLKGERGRGRGAPRPAGRGLIGSIRQARYFSLR